jgi:SAM-dependent methyltransferase
VSWKQVIKTKLPASVLSPAVAAVLSARGLAYKGQRFYCPCCGYTFRRFLPYGPRLERRPRPAVRCPRCNSFERHRLIWTFLTERTDLLSATRRVLHCAPEYSVSRRLARIPTLDYVTADLDSPFATHHFDLTSIPFPDGSFDVILCSHVLEHVPDDRKALSELFRVLRRTGWALLQVPIDPSLEATYEDPAIRTPEARERAYGRHDHVRLYGRDYPERLRASGFQVDVIPFFDQLPSEYRRRTALRREEDIHFCTKQ